MQILFDGAFILQRRQDKFLASHQFKGISAKNLVSKGNLWGKFCVRAQFEQNESIDGIW